MVADFVEPARRMSPEIVSLDQGSYAVGIGWMLDYAGGVQVVYMDGRVTDASFDAYLAALRKEIDERPDNQRLGIVYHVPQPSALSSARRRKLGEVLKDREAKLARTTLAYAMATPSVAVRAGLRMLFWLAPPPYPNAVVASTREAFEFIARHQSALEPEALAAELARKVAAAEPQMAGRCAARTTQTATRGSSGSCSRTRRYRSRSSTRTAACGA
jgi:hypothetical protein